MKWWRILFWACPRRRHKRGGLRKVWQQDGDDDDDDDGDKIMKTWVFQDCPVSGPVILIICSTCVLIFIKFYYPSYKQNRNILVKYWKHFCLSKTCLSIAFSCMFNFCMCVSLPIGRSFLSFVQLFQLDVVEVEGKCFIQFYLNNNYHNKQLFAVSVTASSISVNFKLWGNYESAQF